MISPPNLTLLPRPKKATKGILYPDWASVLPCPNRYAPATDDRCANFSASTCPTQRPLLTTSSTADNLPLEKFHRLLDLVFWIKFLKFDSISCFVFLWDVYRVSLDPVGSHEACGAPLTRPGGRATISYPPPGPRLAITKFWQWFLHCLPLLTVSYNVLRYTPLAVANRLWKWLANSPSLCRTVLGTVLEEFSVKQSSPFMEMVVKQFSPFMELLVQLCLTTCATVSYCLCNRVLLLVQLCLTTCANGYQAVLPFMETVLEVVRAKISGYIKS